MNAPRATVVWLLVVVVFVGFGWLHGGGLSPGYGSFSAVEKAAERAFVWGTLGVSIATCLVIAWWLLVRVAARRLSRLVALLAF